ncbi:minor capsid protein [Fusobacterium periodonticum]|uniref:minor capsid protein n=1 Tax=Fusobacterium periodonticum TaxID=860 RepID=UPI001957D24B|nr:minor capsid protein [Fusobacterium periodonticum]VTX73777.1 NAD(+)--arginine ADP-ribosyltransferase EFV [Fusobacterium periodonticum]
MTQKNRDYWEERQVKREAKAFTTIQDVEKEYQIALSKAKQDIIKEISRITTTYMNDNILNYNEALKHLKGDDYKVWKKDLHDYMKEYNKLLKNAPLQAQKLYLEIETLSAKSRISRLDSLKSQIDMELTKLIFRVENDSINALTSVYRDTFIEVTKDLGINPVVSRDKIKTVLDKPWSGANFSQRLWSNTDKLAETVKQEIVNGMIQGINLKTMTKRVSEKFETAKKNDVERLLRTEVNYVLNQATLDGYKEAGIEKYEFSATLDSRTSQICSELHGNIFEIKNIAVGLNYPPMHPRCRSTTIPIIDYESLIKQGREEIEKNNYTLDENNWESIKDYGTLKANDLKEREDIEDEEYKKRIGDFYFLKKVDKIDYNIAKEIFAEYEPNMVNLKYENAIVIKADGSVYIVLGGENFVNTTVVGDLTGAYITHNHPKNETEFSFSNQDVSSFINDKLTYLKGLDYKYEYELSRDLFESDQASNNPKEWAKFENARHEYVIGLTSERDVRYRRKQI